jgi:hypothetical protein
LGLALAFAMPTLPRVRGDERAAPYTETWARAIVRAPSGVALSDAAMTTAWALALSAASE